MRTRYFLLLAIPLVALVVSGQDWQDCKSDGSYSFKEVKASVYRVTTSRMYSGWDEKIFNRSGDRVSVAILQALNDDQMTSPETLNDVLTILRAAFACPRRCVSAIGDQQPRVTVLLLDHLHSHAGRKMRASIYETKKFVLQQSSRGD